MVSIRKKGYWYLPLKGLAFSEVRLHIQGHQGHVVCFANVFNIEYIYNIAC